MNVREYFGTKAQAGEVGIEIELEGNKFPKNLDKYWTSKADGSLRGNAIEYILIKPLSRNAYPKALEYLTNKQKEMGTTVKNTGNAGIHIHINVQEMSMIQVYNFICLYLMYEDLLIAFCGESREGNFFCLRAKDAEFLLSTLTSAAKAEYWENMDAGGRVRYASINVNALRKFGSLEFRGMRSPVDNDTIILWTEMLLKLKDCSKKYKTPQDIIKGFSRDGQEYFTEKVFGKYAKRIFMDFNWAEKLVEGMWRAQDIAYCRDWDILLNKKTKVRKKKKKGGLYDYEADAADLYREIREDMEGRQVVEVDVADLQPPRPARPPRPPRPAQAGRERYRIVNGRVEIV